MVRESIKKMAKMMVQFVMRALLLLLKYIGPVLIVIIFFASAWYIITNGITEKIAEIAGNIFSAKITISAEGTPTIPPANDLLADVYKALEELGLDSDDLSTYLGNKQQQELYLYKYALASLSTQLPYVESNDSTHIQRKEQITLYMQKKLQNNYIQKYKKKEQDKEL